MNIFYLHPDPQASAKMLCDKHIPKMLLESCQMLSTATQELRGDDHHLYKKAYQKHPSTMWVSESIGNFSWLYKHAVEISKEYTKRYGKIHKSSRILTYIKRKYADMLGKSDYASAPPQCMPDKYKELGGLWNTSKAYKNYYIGEKSSFAKWEKGTPMPDWYERATQ